MDDCLPLNRRTIAIVDDDESIRLALSRQLRAAGYRCLAFCSAEDLLYSLSSVTPDGVLTDIHLDEMTGLELAVHPDVTRRRLPVLIMTGHTDPRFEESAREVAAGFLLKPFLAGELMDAIIGIVGPPIVEEFEDLDDL